MTDTAEAPAKDRAAALLANRQAKMDELYKGQRYKIIKEIHMEGDERFQTPFGNKGRHGFALENESTGERHVVGASMLQLIADTYGAVDVPAKERKRRTKEQKAEDDAREAEAKEARRREREEARAAKAAAKEEEAKARAALKEQLLADG